jgi:O-antigen ligase
MHVNTRRPAALSERAAQHLLLLALFTVAFSTWLTNIFAGLALIAFVITLLLGKIPRSALRAPPVMLALALLAFLVLAAFWSIGPRADVQGALSKYSRLLMLPLSICLCWRDATLGPRAIKYFMGGALVLATSCYLVSLDMMPTSSLGWWRVGNRVDAFSFKNHITIGILLSFATVASLLYATHAKALTARVAAFAMGLYFLVPVVFLTQGRTGYVSLFIGLVAMLLLRLHTTPLRLFGGLAGVVLLFAGFYATSDNFKERTLALVSEVQSGQERTPNGLRMSYMDVGLEVLAEHPLGIGTGGFATAYAPTAARNWPEEDELHHARHQPHSEFLLMAVQLGIPGLALYLVMLSSLLMPALRNASFDAHCLVVLWAIYVTSSAYNSLLWDPTEAFWFTMLAGCLYMTARQQSPQAAPLPA